MFLWKILIPCYKTSMACFWIDIDPIFKISRSVRTDLHDVLASVLFKLLKIDVQHFESSPNNIFEKGIGIRLELIVVPWCFRR